MKLWRASVALLIVIGALAWVSPASAQSDQVVYSTGQYFQNGVMLWRSDTGHIWVIAHNGQVFNFPASTYVNLPDNPSSANGPLFGFGKVWSNFSQVHDLLGPTIYPEVGFYMRIQSQGGALYLTQSNGIIYQINPDGTWVYAQQPPAPDSYIVSFTSDVTTASPNDLIGVRWEVYGVDTAQIEVSDAATQKLIGRIPFLPLRGYRTFTLPPRLTASSVNITLSAVRVRHTDPGGPVLERVEQATIPVQIVEPVVNESSTGLTFQSFEQGFMLWRADTHDIYVLLDHGRLDASDKQLLIYPEGSYSAWPPNPFGTPPAGRVRPEMGFGQVWGHETFVREGLGWATAPEMGHIATVRAENKGPVSISIPGGDFVELDLGVGRWRWVEPAADNPS